MAPLPDEMEYATLPPSIQRKFFSSLERLRMQETPTSAPPSRHTSSVRVRQWLDAPVLDSDASLRAHGTPRQRLRKPQSIQYDHLAAQAEARWFLSLPDKVRTKYLSREEQVLLAARCEALHCTSAEDQWGRQRTRSQSTASRRPQTGKHSIGKQSLSNHTYPGRGRSLPPPSMAESEGPRSRHSRRSSIRRTLSISMSSNPFRHSLTSAPPMPGSPIPPTPSVPSQYSHGRSRSGNVRPSVESSAPVFDPSALHYQDPEARMKLRLYLASPQKFDEAVEFGFPAETLPGSSAEVSPPSTMGRRSMANNEVHRFLRDEPTDLLDEDEDEDDMEGGDEDSSIDGTDGPITPADADASFRSVDGAASSLFSSLDSTSLPPLTLRQGSDIYAQTPASAREMTLRMTLTRPDLRADDDHIYGWQNITNNTPLALEELPQLSDDMTGASGAFAIKPARHSGRFKRLFSRSKKSIG